MKKTIFNAKRAVMTLIAILTIGVGEILAATFNQTYDYDYLKTHVSGGYSLPENKDYVLVDANSDNIFTLPDVDYQPSGNITITISWQYYGNGTENLAQAGASGTETSSNWTVAKAKPAVQPGSGSYNNGVITITKPGSPTTLEGINVIINRASGKKIRVNAISVSYDYTPLTLYDINVYDALNGTFTVSKGGTTRTQAAGGWTLTLSATPSSGYQLSEFTVYDASWNEVTVTNNESFVMPNSDVHVYASFTSTCSAPTVTAGSITGGSRSITLNCADGMSTIGCVIDEYGYVYGTSENPTVEGATKVILSDPYTVADVAYASRTISGLTCGITYYMRPYATNGAGTSYGTQASATTSACLQDHFIDDMHSTTGYTGASGRTTGDVYDPSDFVLSDTEETASGTCAERHYHFVGWVTAANKADPTGHIETITGTATGTTYYAVWAQESSH